MEAPNGYQGSGSQVLYSNGLYNYSPFNDLNRIPVYLNNHSNLTAKGPLITDKNLAQAAKGDTITGHNRQLSPTYRSGVDSVAAHHGQAH